MRGEHVLHRIAPSPPALHSLLTHLQRARPRWDRNPNTGHPFGIGAELQVAQQQILHDREHPSRVLQPVVGPA